jgi:hypothetical protein
MSAHVFVKPAPGFKMRDEYTRQQIPADGYMTELTSLVIRRMMTRVGGTDEDPIFELNKCEPPKPAAENEPAPTRKSSDRAEKVGS